jgi:hypothetical protein
VVTGHSHSKIQASELLRRKRRDILAIGGLPGLV